MTQPANVTLVCGNSTDTFSVGVGATKLQLPFVGDGAVSAFVERGGNLVLDFEPAGFNFSTDPQLYNFNAMVALSGSLGDSWLA